MLCAAILAMQIHLLGRHERFGVNAGYYLSGDGQWAGQMQPAAASADGATGLVPAPLTGQHTSYLRGDGKWIQAGNAPTAAQYLHVANTTGGPYEKNKPIAFPTQLAIAAGTTAIAYSSVTSAFTLLAGYSYKLSASVNYTTTPGVYQWYSISGNTPGYIGTGGNTSALASNQIAASLAVAYITPTVTTTVALYSQQWTIVIPANGAALCTWAAIEVVSNNNTILPFSGATSAADGFIGYIPTPKAGQQNYVLTGNGNWAMNNSITVQNDVTGSRVLGKVYQNTTGKTIFVSAMDIGGVNWHHLQAFSDSNANPTTLVSWGYADGNGCSVSFWVLNNNYYRVVQDTGGDRVQSWIEWY